MITLYDNVMRTIIEIPRELLNKLDVLRKRHRISRAEVIRRSIAEYLGRLGSAEDSSKAFGVWKGRVRDGLSYQRKLRDEWS